MAVRATCHLGRSHRPAPAVCRNSSRGGNAGMMWSINPDLDLTISRVIKAPRSVIWSAWSDPSSFEQWWVPAPARCKVLELDLHPGGPFETQISEDGGDFVPHLSACFLDVVD